MSDDTKRTEVDSAALPEPVRRALEPGPGPSAIAARLEGDWVAQDLRDIEADMRFTGERFRRAPPVSGVTGHARMGSLGMSFRDDGSVHVHASLVVEPTDRSPPVTLDDVVAAARASAALRGGDHVTLLVSPDIVGTARTAAEAITGKAVSDDEALALLGAHVSRLLPPGSCYAMGEPSTPLRAFGLIDDEPAPGEPS